VYKGKNKRSRRTPVGVGGWGGGWRGGGGGGERTLFNIRGDAGPKFLFPGGGGGGGGGSPGGAENNNNTPHPTPSGQPS